MSTEITLERKTDSTNVLPAFFVNLRKLVGHIIPIALISVLLLAGWYVIYYSPYTSDSDVAYYLGLTGGLLMLSLFLYPLRKRLSILRYLGPLRFWFRFHMFAGIFGPVLVVFHSTFQVRSFNAGIAFASMLLVVSSGIIGRLLYRRIHRGLYGRRETLDELRQSLDKQLEEMRSSANLPGEVKQEIERFAQLVFCAPANRLQRIAHFISLGIRRRRAYQDARRMLTRHTGSSREDKHTPYADLVDLLSNIDLTLRAVQNTAQFSTYERLFSYWHTVHIPFLFMLVITAIVHVVAVHAY
jgi:hypothetical protein